MERTSGIYKRPSEATIREIVEAVFPGNTRLIEDGMDAAGWMRRAGDAPIVPASIAGMSLGAKFTLDRLLAQLGASTENAAPSPVRVPDGGTRVLEPDALLLLDSYEGLPEPLQQSAREHIEMLRRLARDAYATTPGVIGKRHPDENEIITEIAE